MWSWKGWQLTPAAVSTSIIVLEMQFYITWFSCITPQYVHNFLKVFVVKILMISVKYLLISLQISFLTIKNLSWLFSPSSLMLRSTNFVSWIVARFLGIQILRDDFLSFYSVVVLFQLVYTSSALLMLKPFKTWCCVEAYSNQCPLQNTNFK